MVKINQKCEQKQIKNVINENKKYKDLKANKKTISKSLNKLDKDLINSSIKNAPRVTSTKKAEFAAKAEAKEARIKAQKAKRLEKTIIISKRTQRGQPLMKDRINYLLKKIQDSKKP